MPPWARTFHASYIRPLQAMDVLAPPLTPNHPDLLAPPGGGQKGSWGGGVTNPELTRPPLRAVSRDMMVGPRTMLALLAKHSWLDIEAGTNWLLTY